MNQNKENTFIRYPENGKIYLHYKGGKYEVVSAARHTETDELLVVYKSLNFGSMHVRPLKMWFEEVTTDNGSKTERFRLIE
jgi:hypothetical protein